MMFYEISPLIIRFEKMDSDSFSDISSDSKESNKEESFSDVMNLIKLGHNAVTPCL